MIQFSQQHRAGVGDVNLTPMIDIIFNLLIFFLIVAVVSQKGLNLDLPDTKSADKRPKRSIEVMVTRDARILFDGQVVPEERIEALLRAEKPRTIGPGARTILLKADEEAPFGKFVMIMDTARSIGLTNLVIATKLKPEKNR